MLRNLLNESNTIQQRLPSTNTSINIEKLSFKFKQLMQKGNIHGGLYLLTNNRSIKTIPVFYKTLNFL